MTTAVGLAPLRIADPEVVTSPMFRILGRKSRWVYPDPRLTPEHCEILNNVNISEAGIAQARFGTAKYSDTILAGGEIATGLFTATFASGTTHNIVTTADKFYTDDGTTRTDKTGSAFTGTNDQRFQFGFIKDKVIINNKKDMARYFDGSNNTADITDTRSGFTIPFTKAEGFFTHKNLLIFYGTTEGGTYRPTRLRWCDVNRETFEIDIFTWHSRNRYEIYDGSPKIIGAVDAWGYALIFKADGMYPGQIVYGETGHLDFRLHEQGVQRGFSPISTLGILARPEFVVCVAKEGIAVFDRDLNFRIVINDDLKFWLELNKGRYEHIQCWVREKDHQVRFLCSTPGNTAGHNRILVWDWETDDIWTDVPVKTLNYGASVQVSDEELDWLGGVDGYVYKGNSSDYTTDDGTGYTWRIKMSPNDLGLPNKHKKVLNVTTFYRKREGNQNVTFSAFLDEGRIPRGASDPLVTGVAQTWNSDEIWNSAGNVWPGHESRRADFFINRVCETIAPEWTSADPASIYGYQVEYIPLEN